MEEHLYHILRQVSAAVWVERGDGLKMLRRLICLQPKSTCVTLYFDLLHILRRLQILSDRLDLIVLLASPFWWRAEQYKFLLDIQTRLPSCTMNNRGWGWNKWILEHVATISIGATIHLSKQPLDLHSNNLTCHAWRKH